MKDKEKEALDCAKKIKEYCNGEGTPREDTCKKCIFFTEQYSDTMCLLTGVIPEDWRLDDIQEKKVTYLQKFFLSLLDKRWKYIAKDKDGMVCVYEFKPLKADGCFNNESGKFKSLKDIFPEDMFDYLSWEDKEASLIEDLLK